MKKLSLMLVAMVVGFVGYAGSVVEWDSTKTTGNWSDGDNWVGGSAPTALDAAKFTVPQGQEWMVTIDSDVTVTNFWVYGGGTLHVMMENNPTITVGAEHDNGSSVVVGNGRIAALVTGKSTLILDGASSFEMVDSSATYRLLSMTDGTSLVVTNGAHFAVPARIPSNGNSSGSTGGACLIVSGEGSELQLNGSKSEIKGDCMTLLVSDKATFRGSVPVSDGAKNFRMDVVDGAKYLDPHIFIKGISSRLYMGPGTTLAVNPDKDSSLGFCGTKTSGTGSDCMAVLDGVTVIGGEGLRLRGGTLSKLSLIGGTTLSAEALNWSERSSVDTTLLVSNATVSISGTTTIGASEARLNTYTSSGMLLVVAKDGVFSGNSLSIGKFSTNDVLFVDGGAATFSGAATIGFQADGYSNAVIKVRGETAALTFQSKLTFNKYAGIALELPLPTEKAVIGCSGTVTFADDTKLEVTVPVGTLSQKTEYTLLTGSSFSGEINPANITVNGEAKATLAKSSDEKSLILTLAPKSAAGMIIVYR